MTTILEQIDSMKKLLKEMEESYKAPVKPREVWINVYETGEYGYPREDKSGAEVIAKNSEATPKLFREVME